RKMPHALIPLNLERREYGASRSLSWYRDGRECL
ncbi:hypothetical protein CSUI_011444, partial [Cystoisospora suis]